MTMIAEILGPSGKVHYRRPVGDPMIAEAEATAGYSVRIVPCVSFMTGLDDGPWLPGCGPRKKRKPKTAAEHRAARAKAWATRRQKLGPKGHR